MKNLKYLKDYSPKWHGFLSSILPFIITPLMTHILSLKTWNIDKSILEIFIFSTYIIGFFSFFFTIYVIGWIRQEKVSKLKEFILVFFYIIFWIIFVFYYPIAGIMAVYYETLTPFIFLIISPIFFTGVYRYFKRKRQINEVIVPKMKKLRFHRK
ncbi:hypothetical protein [Victivallis sp. Marseille-Q1083]|uniref:hypothetical protein n=1 Tax=Victivallis sp. Marseille-Q1083 TaxID=2717288 RepID=UPI00158E7619|nr:hypothetical protein [Victivallis sp. Marseille-Q1083]